MIIIRLQNMKLLLDQSESVRHGLETQVMELQDKLKRGQGPEPAKEMLMKVGSRAGYPSLSFLLARASSSVLIYSFPKVWGVGSCLLVYLVHRVLSGGPNGGRGGGWSPEWWFPLF